MTDQRRDVFYQFPALPYADPRIVLAPIKVHNTVNQVQIAVPAQTGLRKIFPTFLLFVFLLYMIYPIVLACFDCSLENTNLGWIRASFFLNIPFLLTVCIYLIRNGIMKKLPSYLFCSIINILYNATFIGYLLFQEIFFEDDELEKIKNALRNATIIDSLPCPTNYYENVYYAKALQYLFINLGFFISLVSYIIVKSKDKNNTNRLSNSLIINQWRRFINILYKRHQNEIVIEQH